MIETERRSSIFRRSIRLLFVLAVATGCHSCSFDHPADAVFSGHLDKAGKAQGGAHYLALKSKKNGAGVTVRPSRELTKPFRLETTLGLFDPKHADIGATGSFGISVLETGGVGRFFILAVKPSGSGLVLEAGTGGAPINTLTIPDSTIADVEISSVGGLIQFAGRKHGDPAFTPIAVAVAPSAGPYQASLDVSNVRKGAVVGFTRARLTANALPASPTAEQSARETIYTALDALGESMYAIGADVPDRTAAGDQLEVAITRIDAAIAMDLTAFPGASKKLKSARAKASALVAGLRGKKSVAASLAKLRAIVVPVNQTVNPEH